MVQDYLFNEHLQLIVVVLFTMTEETEILEQMPQIQIIQQVDMVVVEQIHQQSQVQVDRVMH